MPGSLEPRKNDRPARAERRLQRAKDAITDSADVTRQAIYEEVRLAAFKVDGAVALSGRIMEELVYLNEHRRHLAAEDPTVNMMLADIQAETVRQVKKIQRGLFDDWDM